MTAPRRPRFDLRESAGTVLVLVALALAANLAFTILAIRPQAAQFSALESGSRGKLRTVEARRKQVESLEAYRSQLEKAKGDLLRLRDAVLSTRDRKMIETQLEVTRIAEKFGTTFDQMRFENEILEDEGLERFGIVVPLEGGYANLRKFIQAVEGSERFIVVERVALAQAEDGGSMLQLNITLATYFTTARVPGLTPSAPEAPSNREAGAGDVS